MDPLDTKKRIFAAHKLLTEKTTSKQKLESVKALIKGINPRIDTFLENSSKTPILSSHSQNKINFRPLKMTLAH